MEQRGDFELNVTSAWNTIESSGLRCWFSEGSGKVVSHPA
jgi:hypothetical protein